MLKSGQVAVANSDRKIIADSDDELMLRVIERDSEAFRTLVERHSDVPFRIGCRMVKDPAEAEDIAQEALLRLWNNASKWTAGGSGVAAWLSRVAINLCLDRLRKKRRMSSEEAPERADDAPLADELMDEERQELAVKDCIDRLGERQRAAVILTYYEEQPNMMAADNLDMKIKGFESLLFRARASLRDCLESSPYIRHAQGGEPS